MKLLHTAHRIGQRADELYRKHILELANGHGLTERQAAIAAAIRDNPGASQTEIVCATGVDRSTLADIVRRLEERGQLERKRTKHDARENSPGLVNLGREPNDDPCICEVWK